VSAHPTDRQIAAFAEGTLDPDGVVSLDAHLSACQDCRARAAAAAEGRLASLTDALVDTTADLHLDDEQLADCADGRPVPAEVARHLAACEECSTTLADLRDLRRAIDGRARPRRLPYAYAAAAAAVLVIGMSLWMWPRAGQPGRATTVLASRRIADGGQTVVVGDTTVSAGLDQLSADERAAIAAALRTGRLPDAPNLAHVRRETGQLMGPGASAADFGPLSPVATAVEDARPRLRWSPLAGARRYVVTIVDDRLRPAAESSALDATEWRPDTPLPRGRVYLWQVRASLATGSRTSPEPPQPEARFFVLGEEDAASVRSLRTRAGDSRLAAILLARFGLMDDVEAALATAGAENPSVPALPRLADAARSARQAPAPDRR
jgi:hypothetical protein